VAGRIARYLCEHLFLAHLYLEDQGTNTVFFKVVRSRLRRRAKRLAAWNPKSLK
jgi:hypothetical protein